MTVILNKTAHDTCKQLRANNKSWTQIARALNSEGYMTKSGLAIKSETLRIWFSTFGNPSKRQYKKREQPEIKTLSRVEHENITVTDDKRIDAMMNFIWNGLSLDSKRAVIDVVINK